ncbi:hypothetical protein MMC29_004928 [Sticta canariensis]|nr:hypothetical protein [Sticta canariensis]
MLKLGNMPVQANLDRDVMVSPMNEYEVLQLLLAECRDRLTAYGSEPPLREKLQPLLLFCAAVSLQEPLSQPFSAVFTMLNPLSQPVSASVSAQEVLPCSAASSGQNPCVLLHIHRSVSTAVHSCVISAGFQTAFETSSVGGMQGRWAMSFTGQAPSQTSGSIWQDNAKHLEDELSLLQSRGLSSRQRVAAQLRLAEKRIIQGALDIVRSAATCHSLPALLAVHANALLRLDKLIAAAWVYDIIEQFGSVNQHCDAFGKCMSQQHAHFLSHLQAAVLGEAKERLAPIRGVPTKEGDMTSPYSDLEAIFTNIEELPKRPVKFLSGLVSWAKGEQDPEWNKAKKKPQKRR